MNGLIGSVLSYPGGPYPRPKLCQWIEIIPTRDDKCKCLVPVVAGSAGEPPGPCAEHVERAREKTV